MEEAQSYNIIYYLQTLLKKELPVSSCGRVLVLFSVVCPFLRSLLEEAMFAFFL